MVAGESLTASPKVITVEVMAAMVAPVDLERCPCFVPDIVGRCEYCEQLVGAHDDRAVNGPYVQEQPTGPFSSWLPDSW
jgi:hypothetical protein